MKRLGLLFCLTATAAAQDGIDWRTDLDKARAEARRTKKPLLAVFR